MRVIILLSLRIREISAGEEFKIPTGSGVIGVRDLHWKTICQKSCSSVVNIGFN